MNMLLIPFLVECVDPPVSRSAEENILLFCRSNIQVDAVREIIIPNNNNCSAWTRHINASLRIGLNG